MNCTECQADFEALLGNRCEEAVRAAVNAHVRECAACAARFAEARQLWLLMGQSELPRPSHGFADRVLRQLDAVPQPSPRGWWSWPPVFRWAAIAALLVLALGIVSTTVVEHRRADLARREQLSHFEDLFNLVQNVDPDTVLNAPAYEDEEAL